MALPETEPVVEKKPDSQHKADKKEKPFTKVVIRRLPPTMDADTFLSQIAPVPSYDYFYMSKGDASLGDGCFSRAYINFTNGNDVYDFKEKFDNYVFLDGGGHEYPAVVEFAAFQKIPKKRHKARVDPKVGTIETDPYYLEFVELLNKPVEPDEKPEYSYQIMNENKNEDTSTPLLEFIKHKRAERLRIREERREERKRRDFEKKKFRDDERKKRLDDKVQKSQRATPKSVSPKQIKEEPEGEKEAEDLASTSGKTTDKKQSTEKETEKPPEKGAHFKNRDKKYDDRKKEPKSKYPSKKEYGDKREFKNRRDEYKDRGDYRGKFDEHKNKEEPGIGQKKVKKYSEKREERKMEAQKAEQKKMEQEQSKDSKETAGSTSSKSHPEDKHLEKSIKETRRSKSPKYHEGKSSKHLDESGKRIRNKDRPTIAIYRPGMLSKRKQQDGDSDTKEGGKKD